MKFKLTSFSDFYNVFLKSLSNILFSFVYEYFNSKSTVKVFTNDRLNRFIENIAQKKYEFIKDFCLNKKTNNKGNEYLAN